jgi:hypothetical protein
MKRFAPLATAGMILFASSSQVFCHLAFAALGEKETLSPADQAAFTAQDASIHVHSLYSVKNLTSNAVAVREYINRDGTVFGLAWKGRNHPDFSALLGGFYSEYQELNARHESTQGVRARGGRRTMQGAHLVVEKFGHMGALKGRAFIPGLMPAGVGANEIK